ncbi:MULTISPECIES: hypothetical protein [unclassified Endozoicomonas]|uniref:hypothetical protein n=1 Tax=unclassified Endozoicomonas TaxID=2644528 RepID=UPI003BB799C5
MDTSNQLTASRTATPPDPASIGTDQQSTGLNNRGSAAGRPVETVSPQASVKADTPVQEITVTTTAQDVTHAINPDRALLHRPAQDDIIDQETAYCYVLVAHRRYQQQETGHNGSSAPSANGGEPLMSNPASTNDTEQPELELSDLLETLMSNMAAINETEKARRELYDLSVNFYRDPSEAKFRQFEKLTDLHFDHLDTGEGCLKHKLPFVIALISEKNNWPIQSAKCGALASEIIEGSSELAKWINSNRVCPEKLDFWWSGFFATGEEKYLEKILKVIGPTTSQTKNVIKATKGAAEWSLKTYCEDHQAVQDFARRMRDDSSLSDYQREYLRFITGRGYLQSITDLLPRCNIL